MEDDPTPRETVDSCKEEDSDSDDVAEPCRPGRRRGAGGWKGSQSSQRGGKNDPRTQAYCSKDTCMAQPPASKRSEKKTCTGVWKLRLFVRRKMIKGSP